MDLKKRKSYGTFEDKKLNNSQSKNFSKFLATSGFIHLKDKLHTLLKNVCLIP